MVWLVMEMAMGNRRTEFECGIGREASRRPPGVSSAELHTAPVSSAQRPPLHPQPHPHPTPHLRSLCRPVSTTATTSSMVRDVSAMLVARTT